MEIKNSRKQISDEDILVLERKLNMELPKDYKDFIKENNGGNITPNIFDFIDSYGEKADSLVHYFYAIYDGNDYNNLESNYMLYNREKRIPVHMLPFAEDPFGNMVCISLSSNDYGKVYFWDHDLEGEEESYDNLSLVSNSFKEFINSLHE